jgi:hypothetical protein
VTALALTPWTLDLLPAADRFGLWCAGFNRMATLDPAGAEEQRLVEAAQRGDREALKLLLDRVARPLYAAVILPRIGAPDLPFKGSIDVGAASHENDTRCRSGRLVLVAIQSNAAMPKGGSMSGAGRRRAQADATTTRTNMR